MFTTIHASVPLNCSTFTSCCSGVLSSYYSKALFVVQLFSMFLAFGIFSMSTQPVSQPDQLIFCSYLCYAVVRCIYEKKNPKKAIPPIIVGVDAKYFGFSFHIYT